MKICTKCDKQKALEEFSKRSRSRDGLYSWCKSCSSIYHKENPQPPRTEFIKHKEKVCIECHINKLSSEFHINKMNKDGLNNKCKDCRSEYSAEYYIENKDKMNENSRKWFLNNPERHLEHCTNWRKENPERHLENERRTTTSNKYGMHSGDYEFLLNAQNGLCALCKTNNPRGKGKGRFHIDHAHVDGYDDLEKSERRKHVRGLLCWSCNVMLGHGRERGDLFSEMVLEYLKCRPFAISTTNEQPPQHIRKRKKRKNVN